MKKIISIILLMFITVSFLLPNYSKALTPTDIIDRGKSFLDSADPEKDDIFNEDQEKEAVDQIYYIALTIGIVVALLVGIYMGIQFITSGVEGQAKIKEKLIPFGVGAFVVFGAFGIWRLVLNIMQSTFG